MGRLKSLVAVTLLTLAFANANEEFNQIKIDEIDTIRKAMFSLDISDSQRQQIKKLEDRLKDQLNEIKREAKAKPESKLSSMYGPSSFNGGQFSKNYTEYMAKAIDKTSVYLNDVYLLLDDRQKKQLINKIKIIEED